LEHIFTLFNHYELKARFFPALLLLTPVILATLIWYPELMEIDSSIIAVIISIIIIFFLAKLCRDRGFQLEKTLKEEWGNYPSISMLKFSDNRIDEITKKRYHKYLKENIVDINLPNDLTEENEKKDFYDLNYRSANKWLVEKTRDTTKYNLLFQDNINYGFSRNMLGVKTFGIYFSLIAIGLNIFGIYKEYHTISLEIPLKIWLSVLVSLFFLFIWIFLVNKNWVKNAADAYARTLLATCEKVN